MITTSGFPLVQIYYDTEIIKDKEKEQDLRKKEN